MSGELLAWLLTGSAQNEDRILTRRQPAVLLEYRRVPVNNSDYPALFPGNLSDQVDGFFIMPISPEEWKALDEFEGGTYHRHSTSLYLERTGETTPAHVYV